MYVLNLIIKISDTYDLMIHKDMGNIAQDNAKNKIMIAKKNIFAKYIAVS